MELVDSTEVELCMDVSLAGLATALACNEEREA